MQKGVFYNAKDALLKFNWELVLQIEVVLSLLKGKKVKE